MAVVTVFCPFLTLIYNFSGLRNGILSQTLVILHLLVDIKDRPMDFLELCRRRHACRAYKPEAVPQEDLDYICECARLAPSARNTQSWRFIVATQEDYDVVEAISAAYGREWASAAPAFVIVCGEPCQAWVRPADGVNHMMVDAGIVSEQICLAAASRGLGSVIICNYDPVILSALLGLPAGTVPYAVIPLGYPASEAVPEKNRKEWTDLLVNLE